MENTNDKAFRIKKKYRSYKAKIEILLANVSKGKVKLEKTKKNLEEVTKRMTIALEEKTNRLNDDVFDQTRSLQQKNTKMTMLQVGLDDLIDQHHINEMDYDIIHVHDDDVHDDDVRDDIDELEDLDDDDVDKIADEFYSENGFRE